MAVNLSPYGGVGAQFLDNAGNVLTGGRIETYAAGTTTPQATYTSSAGITFHANPIILDASGRVPAGGEIWLTDGVSYKFVLKDSNNVLIATYDNVTGINSNFVNFVNQQEIQTATAGQTVFILATTQYQPSTNSLSVFVDGVNQYGPGAQYAYLETNSTTVTFVNGLHVGAEVKFTTSQLNSSGATDASQVSYNPAGTGAVTTNVQTKLREFVSTADYGIPGDMTDDGQNHVRLANAAKQAIIARKGLIIDGTILVSDTVNWDTTLAFYDNTDPNIPNGSPKFLTVRGNNSGDGIYAKASAFTGLTKDVITLRTQGEAEFSGVTLRLLNDGAFTYATMRLIRLLHVLGSDRLPIRQNAIGGMLETNGSVSIGAGVNIWLEDTMSPTVLENFIVYFTRYGICIDNGTPLDPLVGTLPIRVSTSGLFEKNYFGGGWPAASSRDYCCSINLSYGYTLVQNIFENNSRGRAIYINNDNHVLLNNWFEGTYDTVLIGGGFGTQFIGSMVIQSQPTNYALEGVGTYSIPGALPIGTSDPTSLTRTNIIDCGFYAPKTRLCGSLDLQGNAVITGQYKGQFFNISEPGAGDVSIAFGTNAGSTATWVPNDQTVIGGSSLSGAVRFSNVGSGSRGGEFVALQSDAVSAVQNIIQMSGTVGGGTGYRLSVADATGSFAVMDRNLIGPNTDNVASAGGAGQRYTEVWAVNGTIQVSDERQKEQIEPIDERVIRAWGNVQFCQYKFKDAVAKKGNAARTHIGVIAQQVKAAFEAEGLDPFAYGLLCYDEWQAQPELVDEWDAKYDEEGNLIREAGRIVIQPYKPAGNSFSMRYEQALALECAYLRNKLTGV
jgi:hypothetical protein